MFIEGKSLVEIPLIVRFQITKSMTSSQLSVKNKNNNCLFIDFRCVVFSKTHYEHLSIVHVKRSFV